MNIPFHESFLVDTALVVLLVISVFFVIFILHRVLDWIRKEKKYHKEGCFGCLFKFLLMILLFIFGLSFLAYAAYIQTFHPFVEDQLIAEIICQENQYRQGILNFTIIPTHNKQPFQTQFRGDRWYIRGEILTFRPLISMFGVKPRYRIKYAGGKFGVSARDDDIENNYHRFLNYENYPTWNWFYNLGIYFPVIKKIAEVSVSKPPAPDNKFNIYVIEQRFYPVTQNLRGTAER